MAPGVGHPSTRPRSRRWTPPCRDLRPASARLSSPRAGPDQPPATQDLKLKPDQRHRLSLWIQYRNNTDEFASPNTFDVGGERCKPERAKGGAPTVDNQQLRIEVIKSSAPIRTVKRKQILATVLRTMPGDRLNSKWHRYAVNLTRYAGKTVTLRIAEVDNLGEFNVGVDAVKLKSKRARWQRLEPRGLGSSDALVVPHRTETPGR